MSSEGQLLEEDQIVNQKWEILDFIAKGGKGEVYLARQLGLDRRVALKVMSREFLESLEGKDEEYASELQRFRREVQVMASISHPNVLQVFDFDQLQADGQSLDYIVMEYIHGPTLRQTMPEEGFGQDEKAIVNWLQKYFFPVLQGMEEVHARGVVHRDMKPENVLIDEKTPKIADFGLAGGHHMDGITRSYHIIGTPPYMPEEQFLDLATTDSRTDVYSLGKILYEAIEGKMTQERDKPFLTVGLSSPSTRVLSKLDKVIRNATARNRHLRTPSVHTLRQELEEIVGQSEHSARFPAFKKHRRQLMLAGGISGAVILALITAFTLHLISMESPQEDAPTAGLSPLVAETLDFEFTDPRPTPAPDIEEGPSSYPERITGSDGMSLLLVPGEELGQERPGADEEVGISPDSADSFYMDETQITNNMYVDFLRSVEGVEVEDGAVVRNGQVWLLLGEVVEEYEPIVYRDGEFSIRPGKASNPVVRVTPAGARAYAKYHGRDLPTMSQWERAARAEPQEGPPDPLSLHMQHMEQMQHPDMTMEPDRVPAENHVQSVAASRPNALGLRGLGENVNEWTLSVQEEEVEFHIHGDIGDLEDRETYLKRRAWEAFDRVGFRTVLNLQE